MATSSTEIEYVLREKVTKLNFDIKRGTGKGPSGHVERERHLYLLPTGYGKSIMLFPALQNCINGTFQARHIVLIVGPLVKTYLFVLDYINSSYC